MDFSSIRGLILDMDGVIWRGGDPLLDLKAFFIHMASAGVKVSLATNNATKSVQQFVAKLGQFGVEINPELIINSPMSAAYYLARKYPAGSPVYVVGEQGLVDTLKQWGFMPAEENVKAVVAGLDRTLTYPKLSRACTLIRKGAEFVGTNPDLTFPSPEGLTPGAGSVLAFIEAGSSQAPLITGKPEPLMFDLAMERMGLVPDQVLVIGDRLDTDILGGQRAGCKTAAVLTGVSTLNEIQSWQPAVDLVLNNLSDLTAYFPAG